MSYAWLKSAIILMQVKLENFRAFRETSSIDIRPINILVGENSSGKTSFSAALKFIYDIFGGETPASFNSDPFFLGSFRDITHLRGGRAGRAKNFSFMVTLPVRTENMRPVVADLFGSQHDSKREREISLKLVFFELKAQAALSHIEVFYAGGVLNVEFQKSSVVISDERGETINTRMPLRMTGRPFFDLSYLANILRDVRFFEKRRREQQPLPAPEVIARKEEIVNRVEHIAEVIVRSMRELSVLTVATAPVRTEPQRVYQVTEREGQRTGNQAAYDLAQLKAFETKEWIEIKKGLEEFGNSTGLFRQINVRHLSANKDGPFQIELKVGSQTSNIIDVGYGVSQALPLVFDLLRSKHKSVFFIQQPEIHLHPKAQVEIASLICEIAKKGNHTVFIETHSDFIIDRIRADVRDKEFLSEKDVALLFFKREDLESSISQIGINKQGELHPIPDKYREFFLREKMRSLGIS